MTIFGNESNKLRLEKIIREDIAPKLARITNPLTEECIALLISHSRLKQVAKDQHIEDDGSFEDGHLIYLCNGIAQSYYYDTVSDKTFVTRLWKKNDVMFDLNSFINRVDRPESIRMLEDGEVISIDYFHLKDIFNRFPDMALLFSYLQIEREGYSRFYQHLLKLPVEERVSLYIGHNPTLINRINKDTIALHLGISRSRFSMAYTQYIQKNSTS